MLVANSASVHSIHWLIVICHHVFTFTYYSDVREHNYSGFLSRIIIVEVKYATRQLYLFRKNWGKKTY